MLNSWKLKRKIRSESAKSRAVQREVCSLLNTEPATFKKLQGCKRSDTIFIFGSGATVACLGNRAWQEVAGHDSIGVNSWVVHPHVPSYYAFETPSIAEYKFLILENLKARADDYKNTAVIMKAETGYDVDVLNYIAELVDRYELSISVPAYYTVADQSQLELLFKNYEAIKKGFNKLGYDLFFRKRASMVFASMLAYDLGYRDIVFCGVDGFAGSGYFYQTMNRAELADNVTIPPTSGQRAGALHKTMDYTINPLTVELCLRLMYEHLCKRNQVRMWVGTPESMLSEWMPAWKW
jgi:hypothetical protein